MVRGGPAGFKVSPLDGHVLGAGDRQRPPPGHQTRPWRAWAVPDIRG